MITDTDANMMELCFKNGEQHMKEKIIAALTKIKTQVETSRHVYVGDIINVIEKL